MDDDWWRVPISRTYHTVRTPTALPEIYREDRAGDWYLRRVIDLAAALVLCVEVLQQTRGCVSLIFP